MVGGKENRIGQNGHPTSRGTGKMGSKYRVEVRGTWAGESSTVWRPAISGTLNQTGKSDLEASTFPSYEFADLAVMLCQECTQDDSSPAFRIIQIDTDEAPETLRTGQSPKTGCQPIETAPKGEGNRDILVYCPLRQVVVRYSIYSSTWYQSTSGELLRHTDPSHWMPLPEPPK